MEKDKFKIILAVLAVFLFVFELIAMGVIGGGSLFKQQEELKVGQTEFKGIIRTYDPFVAIPGSLSGTLLTEIRSLPGVKEITEERGNTYIMLETRDDVYPTAVYLKGMNMTTVSVANIASPGNVQVVLEGGEVVNASFSGVQIRIETEPIVPPDTSVTIAMTVGVSGSSVVGYQSPVIKSEEKTVAMDGSIEQELLEYTYSIPWSERNAVNAADLQGYGTVSYDKKNIGYFERELSQEEVLNAKQFDYVAYIDKRSVVFSENFTNGTQALSDINVSITFQPSTLAIMTNQTISLNYTGSTEYLYLVSIRSSNYTIPESTSRLTIASDKKIEGEIIPLSIRGKFVGPVLIEIIEANVTSAQPE